MCIYNHTGQTEDINEIAVCALDSNARYLDEFFNGLRNFVITDIYLCQCFDTLCLALI